METTRTTTTTMGTRTIMITAILLTLINVAHGAQKFPDPPGYFLKGDFKVHPHDRASIFWHGPFKKGQPNDFTIRLLNKQWQAIVGATLTPVLIDPKGKKHTDACTVEAGREALYRVECVEKIPGTWKMRIQIQKAKLKGELGYDVKIDG